jgi:hypothetical protein
VPRMTRAAQFPEGEGEDAGQQQEEPDTGLTVLSAGDAVNTVFGFITSTDIITAPFGIVGEWSESLFPRTAEREAGS